MPKNFVPNTPLYFSKAFEFPKDFSRPTFLSEKSRQKNFAQNTPLHSSEAFEFPKDFSRKVLCVRGLGRTAPTFNTHAKKHGVAVLFIL